MPILLDNEPIKKPVAATIGMFDGVHKGHRFILSQLITAAKENGLETAVITFKNHPLSVIRENCSPKLLMSPDDRLKTIESSGIDYVVALEFSKKLSKLTAKEFLQYIHDYYSVRMLITGYDNKFGSNKDDTYDDYAAYGKSVGIELRKCREYADGKGKICSSSIRALLSDGNVQAAAEMLGYNYKLSGTVVGGFANGRKIGFPTANISVGDTVVVPRDGVYAVTVNTPDFGERQGMLNIGTRPTFDNGDKRTVEVNIFDFSGNLYGKRIDVAFVAKIREERKMGSPEELRAQLARDSVKAKELLSKSII